MELSHSLARVAEHLLRAPAGRVEVFVHRPSDRTNSRYVVVCEFKSDSERILKASGVSSNKFEAFVKAIVELGEVVLCARNSYKDRSGIAGGLSVGNALLRAKSELIERDAFLYHYRNRYPFVASKRVSPDVVLFEMSSSDPAYACFLAVSSAYLDGANECLLMGLGSHLDPSLAAEKAINELACMTLDHVMRPGWCESVWQGSAAPERLTDMHHASSRDPRNIRLFREISTASEPGLEHSRPPLNGDWRIERLPSPLRYVRYARVRHPGLQELAFGRPEPSVAGEPPLYHPLW